MGMSICMICNASGNFQKCPTEKCAGNVYQDEDGTWEEIFYEEE